MRAAAYIAGMPFAKVKGSGAKRGAGTAASGLSLGMSLAPVYPQGWHQPLLPPRPCGSGFRGGPANPAHSARDPPVLGRSTEAPSNVA